MKFRTISDKACTPTLCCVLTPKCRQFLTFLACWLLALALSALGGHSWVLWNTDPVGLCGAGQERGEWRQDRRHRGTWPQPQRFSRPAPGQLRRVHPRHRHARWQDRDHHARGRARCGAQAAAPHAPLARIDDGRVRSLCGFLIASLCGFHLIGSEIVLILSNFDDICVWSIFFLRGDFSLNF